jgi:peptidoglycan/xylan/chitin deacetylase (PgdA/CDA1 family)
MATSPARWRFLSGLVVANHLFLGAAGLLPRSRILGPNVSRLPPGQAVEGLVSLTFDDGPDPEVTPAVLRLLAEHGARVSFFFVGRQADRHPDLVAATVHGGHQVENHSYSHSYTFAFGGPATLGREIDRAQEALGRTSGRSPRFFRPPAGIRSPLLEPILARRDLLLASWTRRGYDAVDGNAARVAGRLLKGLASGDVLLLHDGRPARDKHGRPVVLQVLSNVLEELRGRDLRSVPLGASCP